MTAKYEPLQPFLFVSFLEFARAEIVLDVGANIGVYSLLSTLVESVDLIYTFEPDEAAHRELLQNILINGVEAKVKPIPLAVSDKEGVLKFGTHAPMSGVNGVMRTSIHDAELFGDITEVKCTSLDKLEAVRGKVIGVKIDVEGHEIQVIKGAFGLLKNSPSVIQIEHYVGSRIDKILGELGYYRFFAAGHDHYFTNISNFANPIFLKRALEYASACLVESSSGRWPRNKTIIDALTLSYEVNGDLVSVDAVHDERFFSNEVEYAFYLMEDGVKSDERWYRPEPYVQFHINSDAKKVEVKGFVREKKFPQKKVAVGTFVKQFVSGYRASSAVENSRDLPSQYAVTSNIFMSVCFEYSEVNTAVLIKDISDLRPLEVIQLGGDASVFEIAEQLKINQNGRLLAICTLDQKTKLQKLLNQDAYYELSSWIDCYSVDQSCELLKLYEGFGKKIREKCCIIVRVQFLADIGHSVGMLSQLFERVPVGSKVYVEAFANECYREKLKELARQYKVGLSWLYPRSTIIEKNF